MHLEVSWQLSDVILNILRQTMRVGEACGESGGQQAQG